MEKLIRLHIINHMKANKLFSNKQYEFIEGRSTALQLLEVIDKWSEARKSSIQLKMELVMPYISIFLISLLCGTLSKAFWKSVQIQSISNPSSRASDHLSMTSSNCSAVDLPSMNPIHHKSKLTSLLLMHLYLIVCFYQVFIFRPLDNRLTAHYTYQTWRCQGRIQDFKLGGGALKKIASSGGKHA
jgi:hypothetical protein